MDLKGIKEEYHDAYRVSHFDLFRHIMGALVGVRADMLTMHSGSQVAANALVQTALNLTNISLRQYCKENCENLLEDAEEEPLDPHGVEVAVKE